MPGDDEYAVPACERLQAVLDGHELTCAFEYPCPSPEEPFWSFQMCRRGPLTVATGSSSSTTSTRSSETAQSGAWRLGIDDARTLANRTAVDVAGCPRDAWYRDGSADLRHQGPTKEPMTAKCPYLRFRTDGDHGPGRDGYCTVKEEFVADLDVPFGACTGRGALSFEDDCPHYAAKRGDS